MISHTRPTSGQNTSTWFTGAILAVGLFAVTLALQFSSGAYQSEFAGHPDEAAHVVTSLMVRDYLVEGLPRGQHPMRFAENYYGKLPKVALGHYPPGFYGIVAIPLIPFRSPQTVLVMSALFGAGAAFLTWLVAKRFLHPLSAIAVAVAFCCLPLIREYTSVVMSDLLLTIFLLGAAMAWSSFMRNGKLLPSLAFGVLAAAAILTKGSGILLALLPPVAGVLSRRFDLLKNWRLWLAPVPVVLFAAPWTVATLGISSEGWVFKSFSDYIKAAAVFFPPAFPKEFGFTLLVFAIIGLGIFVRKVVTKSLVDPLAICFAALGVSVAICYASIPAGVEERYLIPFVPLIFLAAGFGAEKAAKALRSRSRIGLPVPILTCAVMVAMAVERHEVNPKNYAGMGSVLATIKTNLGEDEPPRVLISSDPRGEGALIAEAAFDRETPWHIFRGSKSLATSDWIGRGYESEIDSPEKLTAFLHESNITAVVADQSIAGKWRLPHHELLTESIRDNKASLRPFPTIRFTGHRRNGAIHFAKVLPKDA
jgi:hypothetical protein